VRCFLIAVYIRVSTEDQNPEGQRQEVQRWLAQNSSGDVRWFEDKESGKTIKRPGFEQLQAAIFAGEIKTVIVWKLDRLARSLRDAMKFLSDWLAKEVRVISTTQQIDMSGVIGQAIAMVFFALAEIELSNIKERQAAGIRAAKARGVYKGRKAGTTNAKPARAKELRAKGLTAAEIAVALGVTERTAFRYLSE